MTTAISDRPWSDYKESDYTLQQWHNACLIHQHTGPPTSKEQCKLPVKTPSGALNRAGIVAAGGALAGARGGVNASADEKQAAAKSVIRYYAMMNMKPPPSIMTMAGMMAQSTDLVKNIIQHFGIKGMHWGVRRDNPSGGASTSRTATPIMPSEDKKHVQEAIAKIQKGDTSALSNKELQAVVTRMNLEQQYSNLSNKTNTSFSGTGSKLVKDVLKEIAKEQVKNYANRKIGDYIKKKAKETAMKKAAQGLLF